MNRPLAALLAAVVAATLAAGCTTQEAPVTAPTPTTTSAPTVTPAPVTENPRVVQDGTTFELVGEPAVAANPNGHFEAYVRVKNTATARATVDLWLTLTKGGQVIADMRSIPQAVSAGATAKVWVGPLSEYAEAKFQKPDDWQLTIEKS